ncbi:dihydrodipicolinate synthase family protein [Achromobacter spanius]|uniref:dihydrodipicolinate synthase family protein n=1 Tax=Achromobacter spanius TaxID=217203 RepID=UPI00382A902B
MFTGLSAFPLTPLNEARIDESAFITLISRLAESRVDSISVLGSTGSYAYLSLTERVRITVTAVDHAGDKPVIAGIGALRMRDVLTLAEDAQRAGARGVLLAPVSYISLTEDEVFGLYETVTRNLSVPLCVYDNPATTHFEFSDDLHGRIAALPNVRSIKIPGVPADLTAARARVERLRSLIPSNVTIGVSGDDSAVTGLRAGCDVWYSVIGGLFPNTATRLSHAVQFGDFASASRLDIELAPLWNLFDKYGGSLRVIAAAAQILGIVEQHCLPYPLRGLEEADRRTLADLISALQLS